MYGLKVQSCDFELTDDIRNRYKSLLDGDLKFFNVSKNNKFLGVLIFVDNSIRKAYIYLSDALSNLPVEERLAFRVLIEE